MSNNKNETFRDDCDRDSWNIPQLLTMSGAMAAVIGVILSLDIRNDDKQQVVIREKGIQGALERRNETFQDLEIIRIGNPEEMNTLKSSGKDAWYIFQTGTNVTYWKKQSGIIESNTYTLTQ